MAQRVLQAHKATEANHNVSNSKKITAHQCSQVSELVIHQIERLNWYHISYYFALYQFVCVVNNYKTDRTQEILVFISCQ